jgi:hypothetical protein
MLHIKTNGSLSHFQEPNALILCRHTGHFTEIVYHFDFARCASKVCAALGMAPTRIDGLTLYSIPSSSLPFLHTQEDEDDMVEEDARRGNTRARQKPWPAKMFTRAVSSLLAILGQSVLVC